MTRPEVSLIVCTRNRASRLRECLRTVAAIEALPSWEVVVVDNGSQDETPSVLANARAAFPVPLRIVSVSTPNVALARNSGWRAASGTIVAYTDDDCYVSPDFVDHVCAAFRTDERLGFLGGSVVRHTPEDDKLTTVTRSERLSIRPGMFIAAGVFITANLAFRKEVLESIGGFDEAFAYANGLPGSDVDAVARAAASGWHGLFDPSLVVRHHHGRSGQAEVERVRHAYDAGRGAFYAKCLLDPRLRRVYLAGWIKMTLEQVRRGEGLGVTVRELRGAARYLAMRRGRVA